MPDIFANALLPDNHRAGNQARNFAFELLVLALADFPA
jgi:hypothetical protein